MSSSCRKTVTTDNIGIFILSKETTANGGWTISSVHRWHCYPGYGNKGMKIVDENLEDDENEWYKISV